MIQEGQSTRAVDDVPVAEIHLFGRGRKLAAFRLQDDERVVSEVFATVGESSANNGGLLGDGECDPLDPIEEARRFKAMLSAGRSKVDIAARRGCSVDLVAERLELLRLDQRIQELVTTGRLPLKHSRVIARLPIEEQVPVALWMLGHEDGKSIEAVAEGCFVESLRAVRAKVVELLKADEQCQADLFDPDGRGVAGGLGDADGGRRDLPIRPNPQRCNKGRYLTGVAAYGQAITGAVLAALRDGPVSLSIEDLRAIEGWIDSLEKLAGVLDLGGNPAVPAVPEASCLESGEERPVAELQDVGA